MACEAHWLRPGETTVGERRTSSAVYHVVEGRGESRVGDAVLSWERGDVFVVPAWHWGEHRNTSPAEPACLFQFNDEPVMRALGLFHEERQP
jgi:gentisate 1,2-dioxygenase